MKISYLIICLTMSISMECQAQNNNKKDNTQVQKDTVAIITENAEKGNVNAQYQLAQWYFNGFQSLEKDQQKAVFWWDKAAKQKDVNAIARLAECYQYGYGVSPDSAYAVSLYESAISRGNEDILNQLDKKARQDKEVFAALLLRDVYQKGIRMSLTLCMDYSCLKEMVLQKTWSRELNIWTVRLKPEMWRLMLSLEGFSSMGKEQTRISLKL